MVSYPKVAGLCELDSTLNPAITLWSALMPQCFCHAVILRIQQDTQRANVIADHMVPEAEEVALAATHRIDDVRGVQDSLVIVVRLAAVHIHIPRI